MMQATFERLDTLVRLPRNPKLHDLQDINDAYDEFGFIQRIIINDVTGRLIAGAGRVDTLQRRKVAGKEAPANIKVDQDGMWLVPADRVSVPESKEEAASLALNRIGENEGYDDRLLASILSDLAADGQREGVDGLAGTGFDGDDLDALLLKLQSSGPLPEDEDGSRDEDEYRCPQCGYEWSGRPR